MRIMFLFFAGLNVAFFIWQSATSNEKRAALHNLATPASIPRLHLLKEGKEEKQDKNANKKGGAKKTSHLGGSISDMTCYALGPFTKSVQTKPVANKLRNFTTSEVLERQTKARVSSGYWVYLPQFDSWQDARAKIMDLEARGMKDVFIMGRGKMKNAVSLGLYASKDAANRRVEQLKRLGAKAAVEVQYTLQNQYWLDIEIRSTDTESTATLNKLANGLADAKLQPRNCN